MHTAPCTATATRQPKARRERLALTLLVTVAIKCLVLYGLWAAFFAHPQTRHMVLPDGALERHLFAAPVQGPPIPNK